MSGLAPPLHANPLRTAWASGRPAIVSWLQIPAALHAEALARLGFAGLVIDLQHSPIDFDQAVSMIAAIELGGAVPLVRVQTNDAGDIMKLLDMGATGIIAPMIESGEEARRLAAAVHYPPQGERSFGPRRPLLRHGPSYAAIASQTIVSFAMVETRRGLDHLDDILAVDGLDGIFIGPSDLALALGRPPVPDSDDPLVVATIRGIRERTHAAGKRVGIYCVGASFAKAKLEEGFDLVSVAPDLTVLCEGAARALQEVRRPRDALA